MSIRIQHVEKKSVLVHNVSHLMLYVLNSGQIGFIMISFKIKHITLGNKIIIAIITEPNR